MCHYSRFHPFVSNNFLLIYVQVRIHILFEFLHKYCVTLNDNITLFQPHFDILFSKNLFETLKVDTLLTFIVLCVDIKSLL